MIFPILLISQVINQPVYGGVNAAVRTILSKLDIEVTWLVESSMENYRNAVKENTKVRPAIPKLIRRLGTTGVH